MTQDTDFIQERMMNAQNRIQDQLKQQSVIENVVSYKPKLKEGGNCNRGAVAIILHPLSDGDFEMLYIKRSEHPQDPWSGHMAFPGGRVDPDDATVLDALYRELREELDVDLLHSSGRLLNQLDDLQAIAKGKRLPLIISPFVFETKRRPIITCNDEVAEIHWIPLSFFLDPTSRSIYRYSLKGIPIPLPCYRFSERIIWGLTYRMLQNFLAITGNQTDDFDHELTYQKIIRNSVAE